MTPIDPITAPGPLVGGRAEKTAVASGEFETLLGVASLGENQLNGVPRTVAMAPALSFAPSGEPRAFPEAAIADETDSVPDGAGAPGVPDAMSLPFPFPLAVPPWCSGGTAHPLTAPAGVPIETDRETPAADRGETPTILAGTGTSRIDCAEGGPSGAVSEEPGKNENATATLDADRKAGTTLLSGTATPGEDFGERMPPLPISDESARNGRPTEPPVAREAEPPNPIEKTSDVPPARSPAEAGTPPSVAGPATEKPNNGVLSTARTGEDASLSAGKKKGTGQAPLRTSPDFLFNGPRSVVPTHAEGRFVERLAASITSPGEDTPFSATKRKGGGAARLLAFPDNISEPRGGAVPFPVEVRTAERSADGSPATSAPPVPVDGTPEEIVKQIHLRLKEGVSEVRLSLRPREVGEVTVVMEARGESVRVSFTAHTESARQALANGSGDLTNALQDLGWRVEHLSVGSAGTGAGGAGYSMGNGPDPRAYRPANNLPAAFAAEEPGEAVEPYRLNLVA